jgi:hypothetical protein
VLVKRKLQIVLALTLDLFIIGLVNFASVSPSESITVQQHTGLTVDTRLD